MCIRDSNHVVEGCNNIVISHKGNRINGKILAVDPKNDLAIIKAKAQLEYMEDEE